MSLLRYTFQGKLTIRFGISNGKLGQRISQSSTFISGVTLNKVYQDNLQTVTELKEAIGKEITSIGSEVTKAVIDRMKKRAQDYIQSGGHHMKNVVFENL